MAKPPWPEPPSNRERFCSLEIRAVRGHVTGSVIDFTREARVTERPRRAWEGRNRRVA